MRSGSLKALMMHSFRRLNSGPRVQQEESASAGASFDAAVAERLQQLQLQGGAASAHLNWLLDACACALSTHSSLAALLGAHAPLRPASLRADEVLSLLDVCTSLKQVADDVDRQLGLLQRALQIAEQALRAPRISGANLRAAVLHRLRACLQGLQVLGSKRYAPAEDALVASLLAAKRINIHRSDPLSHALDGTLLVSLLVLTSALSSFERPTRGGATRSACKLIARYGANSSTCSKSNSSAAAWVAPLRQLQRDLKQEEMGAVFLELEGLHASAASLLAAITADYMNVELVRQNVDSLRKRSQETQACISALRSHLALLFQALLALRLTLLQ